MNKVYRVRARIGGDSGVFMGHFEMFFATKPSASDILKVLRAENPDADASPILAKTIEGIRQNKFTVTQEDVYP